MKLCQLSTGPYPELGVGDTKSVPFKNKEVDFLHLGPLALLQKQNKAKHYKRNIFVSESGPFGIFGGREEQFRTPWQRSLLKVNGSGIFFLAAYSHR